MGDLDEAVAAFLAESREGLDRMEQDLLALERDTSSPEAIHAVYRVIHTVKGTGICLGFDRLGAVAHAGEGLLTGLRDGRLKLTRETADALLSLIDALRAALGPIEASGREGDRDFSALTQRLVALQQGGAAQAARSEGLLLDDGPKNSAQAAAAKDAPSVLEGLAGIRVDVGLLDKLMDLVSELVLSRNQISQLAGTQQAQGLAAAAHNLNLVVTDIQKSVMKTRMQPIGRIWTKYPRIVRDLSIGCGKLVRLEMEGAETELDRNLLEAIRDPLMHLVRNAVDHGIEPPDRRESSGKPRTGSLLLRAYHKGGMVHVELADDGAGIDLRRVREKAVERGLLTAQQAEQLGDQEALEFVFLPGFSTAEAVTSVSGRGVGMDVVKTNVEKVGGSIDVQSVPGGGTTIRLKIPLTLTIAQAIIVLCRGTPYAIPQASVQEMVRIKTGSGETGVEHIDGLAVYRLRGKLIPLVFLATEFGLEAGEPRSIVVLRADEHPFGLVVDEVRDASEIVVKPLGRHLKGVPVFAGASITGDGKVMLILDVLGLAQRTRIVSAIQERARLRTEAQEGEEKAVQGAGGTPLLICRSPDDGRVAIPLELVTRLEEFPASAVETVGGRRMLQYQGRILPLVALAELLEERRGRPRRSQAQSAPASDRGAVTGREEGAPRPADQKLHAVVHSGPGGSVGLVVDRILDIIEAPLEGRRPGSRNGVLATAVIQGRVTELLDMEFVVKNSEPGAVAPRREGGP